MIEIIYLHLTDISLIYCGYNITMNIVYSYRDLLNSKMGGGWNDIALGNGADIQNPAT